MKIEELKKEIESTKSRLETLETDLNLEEQLEELKTNLRHKLRLSSELTNEELGDLCRTVEFKNLLSALKIAGIISFNQFIYDPAMTNVSVADVVCLLSKRIPPRIG